MTVENSTRPEVDHGHERRFLTVTPPSWTSRPIGNEIKTMITRTLLYTKQTNVG